MRPQCYFLFVFNATQVGYCQGISFLAGVLLLHMGEEQAFDMLKFLMYDLGIRRQFRPDMVSLQVSTRVGGWTSVTFITAVKPMSFRQDNLGFHEM